MFKKENNTLYYFLYVLVFSINTCGADNADQLDSQKYENTATLETKIITTAAKNEDASISGIPYSVKFKGNASEDLIDEFKNISMLVRLSERLPTSLTGLGKRADEDKKKFRRILASNGYLGGKVSFRISAKPEEAVVKFSIHTGERYTISTINIDCIDNPSMFTVDKQNLLNDILNIYPSEYVDLKKILESAKSLKRYLQEQGYPFVTVEEPVGLVLHQNNALMLNFKVKTGLLVFIKNAQVQGLKDVEEQFIRNRFQWKPGDQYSIKTIEATNSALANTQLVSTSDIEPSVFDDALCKLDDKEQPIAQLITLNAKITEAAPRFIGVGLKYATGDGIGGHFFWHHNNLFGGQEHFGTSVKVSRRLKRVKLTFDLQDFGAPLQELNTQVFIRREIQRAYSGDTVGTSAIIQRPVLDMIQLKGYLGVAAEKATLKQDNVQHPHSLLGIPFGFTFNTTNSKLDPASGVKASINLTPYAGKLEGAKGLGLFFAEASTYFPLSRTETGEPRFVLAGFIKYGSMFLKKTAFAPLNKRFYAGGAGSVRAYSYQMLGPLDNNRNPLGGRSKIELGGEVRFRTIGDWGFVGFFEGGLVSRERVPSVKKDRKHFYSGFGIGVRYFTSFAPVRVDIAIPQKRRRLNGRTVDAPFQFYISVGQAF